MFLSSCSSTLLVGIASLLGVFYLWAKWKLSYWQRRGVPTLPTDLLFGNLKDSILMKVSPGYVLGRLYREADDDAPFVGVYIMHNPFLLLRSPEMIKQILVKDFSAFSDRYFAAPQSSNDPVGSLGLFSIKNPEWRYLRTKLSPAFTSGKLKNLFGLMLESAESLNAYITERFRGIDGGNVTIEFKDTSTRYTTDVISSLAFGIRTNSFENPPPEFYKNSWYFFDFLDVEFVTRSVTKSVTIFFSRLLKLFRQFQSFSTLEEILIAVFVTD